MNSYQASVLIHVDESVGPDQHAALLDVLGDIKGVTQVRPGARPHLTLVAYNPGVTGGKAIIGRVKGMGLHAQLIGF